MSKWRKRRTIRNAIIVTLLAVGFLYLAVGCIDAMLKGTQYPGLNVRAKLIVEGNPISDRKTRIFQRGECFYGHIPVFATLRQMGYQAEWVDDETALVTINGQTYEYRKSKLMRPGEKENYLDPGNDADVAPIEKSGQEIYTTTYSFLATMEKLGVSIDIELDIENRCIFINRVDQ